MASHLRRQMEERFFKARDEYIAAIQAHSNALASALETAAPDVNAAECEQATAELARKHEAYRQATDDIRSVNSREAL